MKKLRMVWITEEEKNEVRIAEKIKGSDTATIDKIIESVSNQTLLVTRQVKNGYKWTDVEDTVNFVDLINKIQAVKVGQKEIDLENAELDLLKKVFEGSLKEGGIRGFGLEKYVVIFKTITAVS